MKLIAGVPSLLAGAIAVAVGFMMFTAWNQSHWWQLKDDYAFGWLAPLFASYVIYQRWRFVVGASIQTRPDGKQVPFLVRSSPWVLLCGGALFFAFGALSLAAAGASYPASLALALGTAGVTLGLIWLAARTAESDGWHVARLFVFPALVWLVSAPMVSVVENTISLFLLGKVMGVVFFVFDGLGLAIEKQGNVLILPGGAVGVADACSGIRSVMGCLFAGAFLGAMCFEQLWKKVTLVLAAALFALAMNLLRSVFLTGWAYRHGPEAIEGSVHDWTGYAVIGVTTLGLLGLTRLLNLKVSFKAER